MRIGTLFSGIGAPEQAASRLWENHSIAFACEYDKFARQSYTAIYDFDGEHFHKDVREMNGTQYKGKCDLLVGGSPCQAFSIAGLRNGTDDERGQLIYQYIRIVDEVKAPIIVYENVKGMLSIDSGNTIKEFVEALRQIGYYCHYDVLNTKDYGVPQNRERIFLVGFLDHEAYYRFQFAPKIPLEKRLKDILESEVDEKYYLSSKMVEMFENKTKSAKEKGNGFAFKPKNLDDVAFALTTKPGTRVDDNYINEGIVGMLDIKGNESIRRVYGTDGSAPCLQTMQGGNREPKILAQRGRYDESGKTSQQFEKRDDDLTNTITCVQKDNLILEEYRIRKLTPLECWRLQDFPDSAHEKSKVAGVSDSQRYKQAGNSMTVAVVEMIFRQIDKALKGETNGGLF